MHEHFKLLIQGLQYLPKLFWSRPHFLCGFSSSHTPQLMGQGQELRKDVSSERLSVNSGSSPPIGFGTWTFAAVEQLPCTASGSLHPSDWDSAVRFPQLEKWRWMLKKEDDHICPWTDGSTRICLNNFIVIFVNMRNQFRKFSAIMSSSKSGTNPPM